MARISSSRSRRSGRVILRVAQAPAVAFVLVVAEQLFDGHAPAIEAAQLRGPVPARSVIRNQHSSRFSGRSCSQRTTMF